MANSVRSKTSKANTTSPTKPLPAKGSGKKTEARKAKAPSPPAAAEDEEEDEEGEEEEDENGNAEAASDEEADSDEEVLLQGFSSESDSSDEEDGVDAAPIDVGKLPTVARDDASVKRKLEKAKKQPTEDRGVLYLGHIPHGFFEDQMKSYFSQFGDVTRLRLSRNKRTGASKHYAFIEFSSSAVAEIVAETMDNYLLMGHILRCKVVPKDDVHPELWLGANRKWRRVPAVRLERLQQNKTRTAEEQDKVERRLLKRQAEKKRKLQASGIDYDFGPVAYTKKSKQAA